MSEELKPCRFCGSRTAYTAPPVLGERYRWVVQCGNCRAEGPPSSTDEDEGEAEARASWNTRAPDDSAVVVPDDIFETAFVLVQLGREATSKDIRSVGQFILDTATGTGGNHG